MTIGTIISILSLLCGSGLLVTVGRYFLNRIKATDQKTEAVCLGVQALLRSQMIADYNKYVDKGYAPIYAKQNFENMWKQYHNLGANGVMDEIHRAFIALPDREVEDHEN